MGEPGWVAVVPVKPLAAAKTRLRGALPDVPHDRLVLALATDTVRAVVACPLVVATLVVTDDPDAAGALGALGARIVPDRPTAGLNPALRHAASLAPVGAPVAALTADLPALRPAELAAALAAAAANRWRGYVVDAAGTGTTLLAAPAGTDLHPRFGPGSAARHAAARVPALAGDWPGLRRDVDLAADLAAARRLGLGPATARLPLGLIMYLGP